MDVPHSLPRAFIFRRRARLEFSEQFAGQDGSGILHVKNEIVEEIAERLARGRQSDGLMTGDGADRQAGLGRVVVLAHQITEGAEQPLAGGIAWFNQEQLEFDVITQGIVGTLTALQ